MIKILPPNEEISISQSYKQKFGPYSHTNKSGGNYGQYTVNYTSRGQLPDMVSVQNGSRTNAPVEGRHWLYTTGQNYGYYATSISENQTTVRVYNLSTSSTHSIYVLVYWVFTEEELIAQWSG